MNELLIIYNNIIYIYIYRRKHNKYHNKVDFHQDSWPSAGFRLTHV